MPIIELGGGFSASDLAQYFKGLGLKGTPAVTAVGVAGGSNQPGGDADGEVMLDIEVIGALAPGAKIAVYFAPNTDQGFYEAISQAAHDAVTSRRRMSISWGGPEDSWTAASRTAMNSALEDAAALAVTVTVACGDNGSSDGESNGGRTWISRHRARSRSPAAAPSSPRATVSSERKSSGTRLMRARAPPAAA